MRPLSDLGNAMLEELPTRLRGSYSYQAVIHACAREIDLLESAIEVVRSQFNVQTADVLLSAWEAQVKLPVGGQGADNATRRAKITARIRKLLGQSQGREWQDTITGILGPSWSYEEHDPADPSSPPDGEIQITVPFASGTSSYLEAVQQVREVTAAHLEVTFVSTAAFELDVSELDVQEFGG